MKAFPTLLFVFFVFYTVDAQHRQIREDIFGNLESISNDRSYNAKLVRNIFDDLVFTDSKNNKLHFEKKYLEREFPGILSDKKRQSDLLARLIRENRRQSSYSAKFSIDIFDNLKIEDNKGYKLERGTDIFGNENVVEEYGNTRTSFKRNLSGGLEYTDGSEKASLSKDIFDRWIYKDSFGNEIQFGKNSWERILRRYKSEESVFNDLLDDYFYR
ncbi:hypothetical protein [Sphingobacterium luzhongxinii]|uniref:hypothetical protein n=1 Tax=Sphingobacterium luzhongxinii TaxID=2654181 RepID=UPI0013DCF48C|nr:hypothetical protein [Sphingobacterium sp. xlx-73]